MSTPCRLVGALVFLWLGASSLSAQSEDEQTLFKQGISHYQNNEMLAAITDWKKVVEKASTDSKIYLKALTSIPIAYEILKDWVAAEAWYLKIFDENEHSESSLRYKKYRHFNAKQLSKMQQRNKNWAKALKYLSWAEKKYPLISNREEAYAEAAVEFTLQRAEIHAAQAKPDSAIHTLITALFNKTLEEGQEDLSTPGSIGQQAPVLEAALAQISETYNKYYFQQELGEAIDNINLNRDKEGDRAIFELKGVTYEIKIGGERQRKKEVIDKLRNSYFFQLLRT